MTENNEPRRSAVGPAIFLVVATLAVALVLLASFGILPVRGP